MIQQQEINAMSARELARGLMRGDPASLKMGYSAASAALTVRDMRSLGDDAYQALLQYAEGYEHGLAEGRRS